MEQRSHFKVALAGRRGLKTHDKQKAQARGGIPKLKDPQVVSLQDAWPRPGSSCSLIFIHLHHLLTEYWFGSELFMKIAEPGAPPLKELTPKKEAGHVSRLLLNWSDLYSSFALVHLWGKPLLVHTPFLVCVTFLCCQGFLDILANSGYRNM